MTASLSPLDFALLGLLARGPASGYDLRRVFQTTALGRYSDSPGSIYPALRRLEAQGLVTGRDAQDSRRRRLLRLSAEGRRRLEAWIAEPVRAEDLMRDPAVVDLRLAFVSDAVPGRLQSFLREYAAAAAEHASRLEAAREDFENDISASAGLAFDLGLTLARARAAWCEQTSETFEER